MRNLSQVRVELFKTRDEWKETVADNGQIVVLLFGVC